VQALIEAVRRTASEAETADALANGRALLERAPDSWIGLAAVGTSLATLEGPDAARPYLLKAWVRQPTSGTLAYRLAQIYAQQERPGMALDFLDIALDGGLADPRRSRRIRCWNPFAPIRRFGACSMNGVEVRAEFRPPETGASRHARSCCG